MKTWNARRKYVGKHRRGMDFGVRAAFIDTHGPLRERKFDVVTVPDGEMMSAYYTWVNVVDNYKRAVRLLFCINTPR